MKRCVSDYSCSLQNQMNMPNVSLYVVLNYCAYTECVAFTTTAAKQDGPPHLIFFFMFFWLQRDGNTVWRTCTPLEPRQGSVHAIPWRNTHRSTMLVLITVTQNKSSPVLRVIFLPKFWSVVKKKQKTKNISFEELFILIIFIVVKLSEGGPFSGDIWGVHCRWKWQNNQIKTATLIKLCRIVHPTRCHLGKQYQTYKIVSRCFRWTLIQAACTKGSNARILHVGCINRLCSFSQKHLCQIKNKM